MRVRLAVFGLPALLAAVVVLVSPASALTGPQTFSLLSVESPNGVEIGGFGFQRAPVPGDRFAFTDQLYKWAGAKQGAQVGRDEGLCTFTKIDTSGGFRATAQCTASFFLPAGQIVVSGFVHFTDAPLNFAVPVIGGTGAYANARGYVRIRDIGGQDSGKSNNVFHLLT
jgi:hypothetical protein